MNLLQKKQQKLQRMLTKTMRSLQSYVELPAAKLNYAVVEQFCEKSEHVFCYEVGLDVDDPYPIHCLVCPFNCINRNGADRPCRSKTWEDINELHNKVNYDVIAARSMKIRLRRRYQELKRWAIRNGYVV